MTNCIPSPKMPEPKMINIKPTWASVVPLFVNILQNPKLPATDRQFIQDEMMKMAKVVDRMNDHGKLGLYGIMPDLYE